MKKDKLQSQTFLTATEYNKIISKNNRHGNCLSFAFGQTSENYETFDLLTITQIIKLQNHCEIEKVDISEAFVRKAKEFGYNVKPIHSLDETSGQLVFIVFGWYIGYIADIGDYEYFFHIIRKNENGLYEHKPNWDAPAKKMSKYELNKWFKFDIERYYFVVS